MLGNGEHFCRLCGTEEEMGHHLVIGCRESHDLPRWEWLSQEELDDCGIWPYMEEIYYSTVVVRDRVGELFEDLDRVLSGIG